ncbi:hypothetical protein ACR6HW_18230 [Fusibacter sp. JL298sf-3]
MTIFTALIGNESQTDNMWFTIKYLVVATLFLLLLWRLSKWLIRRNGFKPTRIVKVHQTTPFTQGKWVTIMEIDGVFYIVASDKNGMVLLDKRETLDLTIAEDEGEKRFTELFKKQLVNQQIKRGDNQNEHEDEQ